MLRHAIVICTYGRPATLRQTLRSVADQAFADPLLVVVVEKAAGEPLREGHYPFALQHVRYAGSPSAACQRNAGLDRLPDTVEQVFFLDDDVTLEPGYLRSLRAVLDGDPSVGGAGGVLTNAVRSRPSLAKRLFLLAGRRPGRVLPSGQATFAQFAAAAPHAPTQWLSTCSSVYRRSLLKRHRFDEAVPGAMLEDLDLSLRVGREARLVVDPGARLHHHKSARSRPETRAYASMSAVQRYWFVEKNLPTPYKAAYWWATLGQALARLFSQRPGAHEALRGLWEGTCAVWQRDHPLLQGSTTRANRSE